MVGAFDWQLVLRVVVDHLGNAVERLTELSEDKSTVMVCDNLQVHESHDAPVVDSKKERFSRMHSQSGEEQLKR